METTQLLLHQYSQLPENLQMEVLHFVEFLTSKLKIQNEENETDLTYEQKQLLSKRLKSLEQNPENGINWFHAHKELITKYQ